MIENLHFGKFTLNLNTAAEEMNCRIKGQEFIQFFDTYTYIYIQIDIIQICR